MSNGRGRAYRIERHWSAWWTSTPLRDTSPTDCHRSFFSLEMRMILCRHSHIPRWRGQIRVADSAVYRLSRGPNLSAPSAADSPMPFFTDHSTWIFQRLVFIRKIIIFDVILTTIILFLGDLIEWLHTCQCLVNTQYEFFCYLFHFKHNDAFYFSSISRKMNIIRIII